MNRFTALVCVQVYLILWFWFFSLLVVTGAQLVVRVTTLTIPPLRLGLLILRSRSYNSADIATIRSTSIYQIILYVSMMCQPIKNKCAATENIITFLVAHNLYNYVKILLNIIRDCSSYYVIHLLDF